MARYLIKFVSQLSHAENLRSGNLFMRPASYYHDLEIGQGDITEGAISHQVAIYQNSQWAIYCMYTVKEDDIDRDGNIHISNRVMNDFTNSNGYAVVIDRDKFEKRLSTVKTNGYALQAGEINYHYITFEDMGKMLTKNEPLNLAIKHPYFSYQNEYRIVISRTVPHGQNSIDYYFPSDLCNCSCIIPVSKMIIGNDEYIISKREVNFNG